MRAVVVGSSLPGLACALRLAKVGHDVVLIERDETLGGRWRDPDLWPPLLHLPAAWRDLLRKSGRTLEAELARSGLALTPAPATRHRLDGVEFELADDRGTQTAQLDRVLGPGVGSRWTAALDAFDADWQRLRRHGLEADDAVDRAAWKALHPAQSLAAAAADLGPAAPLLTWFAAPYPARDVPAWEGARASVAREFGSWQLTDAAGRPADPRALLELMLARLETRGVEVRAGCTAERLTARSVATTAGPIAADAVIDATSPWSGLHRAPRRLRPALVPRVTTRPAGPAATPAPLVDHAASTLTFVRGTTEICWDYAHPAADPSAGAAWRGPGSWRRRPALVADGIVRASAASRGGPEPWAQLLTGALAAYAAHDLGGGRSIRPVDDPRRTR